jgi:tetratricopeptide (TPR) repeat protein
MRILVLAFLLLMEQASFGQDCRTLARSKPREITRFADQFSSANNRKPAASAMVKMKPQLAKVESWIMNLLAGLTGAKVGYTNEYFFDNDSGSFGDNLFKATGIKGYYGSTTRFWAYYCHDNSNIIRTQSEAGSFVYVNFNNVLATHDLTDEVGLFTVNGKPVFRVLEKSHSEGRIDFYDLRKRMDFSDTIYTSKREFIIIRNSDKPVFIPITRKEYLQQMLKDVEASRAKQKAMMTGIYNNAAKSFEEEMKRYKLDKNYTPDKEAKRRKWFEEDQAKYEKQIKKIDADVDASIQVIRQYLQKPAEWLSRSLNYFYSYAYTANGITQYLEGLDSFKESREDYTRSVIVSINPDYFDKTLSPDVPQLIMVEIVKNGYWYMYKLSDKIKQSGAIASLVPMVNFGKLAPAQTVPPVVPSTYTLKYIPKLTTLTPLVIPAGMKPPEVPLIPNYASTAPAAKINFDIPATSAKLSQLPQLKTEESYTNYIQQLNTSIANAIKPEEKKKADDYIRNKKLTQSKDIGNTALASWLQNKLAASLYLFSKAIITNPADALTANNFSAFLLMGGLPEKSIPILEYWNKQKPGEPTILSNLGNAYYRLGDVDKAMKFLQQCVQADTLNATANKILCLLFLKQGDTKKAEEHGTRSISTSHDEQVISILRQLNKQIKPGVIMSRFYQNEFPLMKRIRLPLMPTNLDDMDQFTKDLEAEKKSIDLTRESIEAKMTHDDNLSQRMMKASFTAGLSPLRAKAQHIVMDAMQAYEQEAMRESQVFKYQVELLKVPYNSAVTAIHKKYNAQLNKLEGGEAGDEDQIAALELAKCREVNAEKEKYLAKLAPIVNQNVARQEYILRKLHRDFANWVPYWLPKETVSFLSIERDYLKGISSILSSYKTITKSNCETFETDPVAAKEVQLKEFEDEYCANFKGKIGLGPASVSWTCNSWGIEGGEGIVGEFEASFAEDGSFEAFTLGGGLGAEWHFGVENIAGVKAGASVKEFIKLGVNKATGRGEIKDFGMKADATLEGNIGRVSHEVKVLELSVAVNAGLETGGVLAPVLHLK